MKDPAPIAFDLSESPLGDTTLIEASAGTGKTYTLTGLFLRLIIEKGLSVREIAAVTFTEAATAELKQRIRDRLGAAFAVFSGESSDDPLLLRLKRKMEDPAPAREALQAALREFDQAAVFTIHGFCRRILREHAFETGVLFDTELITDEASLKEEVVEDFWRKHLYAASALFVRYARSRNVSPASLASLLARRTAAARIRVIPRLDIPRTAGREKDFVNAVKRVRKAWPAARDAVERILKTGDDLSRTKYPRKKIDGWIQAMDRFARSLEEDPDLFAEFDKFTQSTVSSAVKSGGSPLRHPFFETCEDLERARTALQAVFDQRLLALKRKLFDFAERELAWKKSGKNVHAFDDLLLEVHRALSGKTSAALARSVGRTFKALLVDEFQDTDPVQYAIFRDLFGIRKRILFLIGDPKQAIYAFRGADIFAYLKAREEVNTRYTLRENWRSDPGLIDAVNTLFSAVDRPFVYDQLPFFPTEAAGRNQTGSLRVHGKSGPPLVIWGLPLEDSSSKKGVLPKGRAREIICPAVAAEISRLVRLGRGGKAWLTDRPLREADIAVLTRTNAEAGQIQEALSALEIPSVVYSTSNLFDSREALDMERLLTGIVEPNDEGLVRAALTTDVLGMSGNQVARLINDEVLWELRLLSFNQYRDLWHEKGFIHMFGRLLAREEVRPRLMALPRGERRLTNLLHLAEVLHRAAAEGALGMSELLHWLSERRDTRSRRLDEHQLRLESDENAVNIVTIHRSKGLEFPIVFCPFAWGGSLIRSSGEPFLFHDETRERAPTLDLGSSDADRNRELAEKELLAENLRLFYVALTRAKNRCYTVWGPIRGAETSAPAYLFHLAKETGVKDPVHEAEGLFERLGKDGLSRDLEKMAAEARGTILIQDIPRDPGTTVSAVPGEPLPVRARSFSGTIERHWRVSSFTGLVSERGAPESEAADRDAVHEGRRIEASERPMDETPSDIHSFPKGAKAGIFFHDLLEHLDFTDGRESSFRTFVSTRLEAFGFPSRQWEETVCRTVRKVLDISLDPNDSALSFSRIPNRDRLNELEFTLPLKPLSPEKLKSMLLPHRTHPAYRGFPEHIERLHFSPTRGFMRGFMDLVFHWQERFFLVDWKSNYLGDRIEDYGQESLHRAMHEAFYVLQYMIYTLALDQYLRLRIPDYQYKTHFGGIFYVFLRGVDPLKGPEYGIFRDRPPEALIRRLRSELIDGPVS